MVDKLRVDSAMALFGAPLPLGDDLLQAVRCALEMQQEWVAFHRERTSSGLPPLHMGIDINTARVIAGNLGSSSRMEYPVIGDNVNVASRLQGVAKPGGLTNSPRTFRCRSF